MSEDQVIFHNIKKFKSFSQVECIGMSDLELL